MKQKIYWIEKPINTIINALTVGIKENKSKNMKQGIHGVEQNYEKAVNYFIATNNKNMLGECYLYGLGVERNVEKSISMSSICLMYFVKINV